MKKINNTFKYYNHIMLLINNHILKKVVTFSESTSKIKLTWLWTLFLIFLMSAVILHFSFLQGKEITQYLLNWNATNLSTPFLSSHKVPLWKLKIETLQWPAQFSQAVDFFRLFLLLKCYNHSMIDNYKKML